MKGKELILCLIILCSAFLIRFWLVDLRPLQFDEGVNFGFINTLIRTGEFSYNPINFHGPLFFYLNALFIKTFNLAGDCVAFRNGFPDPGVCLALDELEFRLVPVIAGSFLALLPLFFRDGNPFAVFAAALIMITDPSLVFLSRQNIHEIYVAVFSTFFLLYFYRYLKERGKFNFIIAVLCLGLLAATKETWIVTLFAGIVAGLPVVKERGIYQYILDALIISACGLAVASLFYFDFSLSSLFSPFAGLLNWSRTGLTGSNQSKPFYFYLVTILKADPVFYGLAIIATGYFIAGKISNSKIASRSISTNPMTVEGFLILSSAILLLVYSLFSYKTPWLIITIIAPGLAGVSLYIFGKESAALRWLAASGLMLLNLYLVFSDDKISHHPLQPVPSYQGARDLTAGVSKKCNEKLQPENCSIAVIGREYWPLPFYLQNFAARTSYYSNQSEFEDSGARSYFDFVIREVPAYELLNAAEKVYPIHGRLRVVLDPSF